MIRKNNIQCDLKLCKTPSGKFYMHVPYKVEKNSGKSLDKCVAIDPWCKKVYDYTRYR